MDISIKMNLSLVKEALSLKGLVDQDCMTVCTTSDIQIWLEPGEGAHSLIGWTLLVKNKFQWFYKF